MNSERITVRYVPEAVYRADRFFRRAALFVGHRFFGGVWFRTLGRAFRYAFGKGCEKRAAVLCFCVLGYFLGQSPCVRIFTPLAKSVEALGLDFLEDLTLSRAERRAPKKRPFADLIPCAPPKALYHLIPEEDFVKAMREGLHCESGRVFLTDNVASQKGYMVWKTRNVRKMTTVFRVVAIDPARLCMKRELYEYCPHEYVVERVEPEFLIGV